MLHTMPAEFERVLAQLRSLAAPCDPPVGVGQFLVLYANDEETVVWYLPAREQHQQGEVVIPTTRLRKAWEALQAGTVLDGPALESLGEGPAGGTWLLALLAQITHVQVQQEPLRVCLIEPCDDTGSEAAHLPAIC